MLAFNEYIGKEKFGTEYKGFSFYKTGLPIDVEKAEQYCQDKLFEFDDLTLSNINAYIEQYVPRYACGFVNSMDDFESKNEIYFGINDFGLVKGIPCKKILNKDIIENKIKTTLDSFFKSSLKVGFTVELINVDCDTVPFPITKVHEKFTKYLSKKEEYFKRYTAFTQEANIVKEKYDIINFKLVDIVNNPIQRKQLQDYIRTIDPTNPVITILDTDFMLQQISGEDLRDLKKDKNNPYYWVTTYKDSMIEEYKKCKPVFNELFRQHTPLNILISVDEMIPYWVHSNDDLKLVVIKITFDFESQKDSSLASFYDVTTQKWSSCKRVIEKGQPMCIPVM